MVIKTTGTQKESQIINLPQKARQTLHYNVDYDSTLPEQTIRDFVSNVKGMLSRYENNKIRVIEIEAELEDLMHYMEIASYKTVPNGYKLYRKLAELRRERRSCKNENDLLQPIYEYFHATDVLNKLTYVQGQCAIAKEAIDARVYGVRTDILDDLLEPEKKTEVGLIQEDPVLEVYGTDHPHDSRFSLAWEEGEAK